MRHHAPSRLNFEFPENARKILKIQAVRLGISMRELATQAILEKLESLELQADTEAAEQALERHEAKGSKTISHEEMVNHPSLKGGAWRKTNKLAVDQTKL